MQIKDEEYLKRNILAVYFNHQDKYVNLPYYRFMGQPEFYTLFQDKKLYFTNPVEWKNSTTGDKNENYLEDWFTDESNITEAYRLLKQHCKNMQKQYCTQQYIMSVYSNFIGAVAMLQQTSFCYCIANTYSDKKMIDEYHTKYGRNIIISFKNDFYKKLAVLSDGKFVPSGTYLYADVMPMVYVQNFEKFIKEYICTCQPLNDIAKNAFDYGSFLKDETFKYEHETRVKIRMHMSSDNMQYLSNEFYRNNFFLEDEEKIISISMSYIQECRNKLNKVFEEISDHIKMIANKQCFELRLGEIHIEEIVECVLLHNNASTDEKDMIYNLTKQRKIPVKELDFDSMYLAR